VQGLIGGAIRTDGHGVQRAASGMLVTTEARNAAERHALSIDET
jgi:type VI secretion system secreted protein VgrG